MRRNNRRAVCLLLSIFMAGSMAWCTPVHATESNAASEIAAETFTAETPDLGAEAVNAAEAAGQEIAAAVPAEDVGTLAGYTLEEISTFEDASVGTLDVERNKLLIEYYDDKTVVPLSADGQIIGSTKYSYIDELSPANGSKYSGYYMVSDPSIEGENNMGLIDINGEELIPCEAVWIDWIRDGSTYGRFVEVVYSTGESTEADGYFICIRNLFGGEKHYYKGYAKVFDLVNKTFVGDIEINNNDSFAISGIGSSIVVEDPSRTYTVYNNSGEKVFEGTNSIYAGPDYFYVYNSGNTAIYDENGQELNSISGSVNQVSAGSEYLSNYTDSKYAVIDKEGNQILPDTYSTVYSEENGIFYVKNADETKYQLVNMNGDVLYEATDYITWVTNDYWYARDSIGNTVLIGPDGVISDQLKDGNASNLTFNKEKDFFVINDGDYTLTLNSDYPTSLYYAMVADRGNSGKYTIYDLFTGQKLLDQEYDKVMSAADYVYALDGTTWHAFKIHEVYK